MYMVILSMLSFSTEISSYVAEAKSLHPMAQCQQFLPSAFALEPSR
uniref:U4/U6 small nuclear ribonucleoprotein Prp3, putative n=1 Tax=Arundo donax TaxID=35708 RepID=A0A0A9EA00_ARUDO